MRIIAGAFKGRRLAAPRWAGLRPTSDRLRETLFDVLGDRVVGARVLDGYAGTGAVGLEAISRGAREVVLVERDPRAVALVAENVRRCGATDACVIIRGDMGRVARRLRDRRFDLILLDPPYATADLPACLLGVSGLLAEPGLMVVEHARRTSPPPAVGALVRVREVGAGDSRLSLYARPAGTPPQQDENG